MNKTLKLTSLLEENNLIEANTILLDILEEKILIAINEKKLSMLEGQIKVNNKKKKSKLEVRAGRSIGGISAKHTGRNLFRTMQSTQLKTVLATEGEIKDTNKRLKKDLEKVIQKNLEKNHGGGYTGRLAMKLLPSSTIKSLSKKEQSPHWVSQIGFYRNPIEEYINEAKPVPYKEVHKMLTNAGFNIVHTKGSHIKYQHPNGRSIPIAHHNKEVSVGIVRQINSLLNDMKLSKLTTEHYNSIGFHSKSTDRLKKHLRITHPNIKQRKNRKSYKNLHKRLDRK